MFHTSKAMTLVAVLMLATCARAASRRRLPGGSIVRTPFGQLPHFAAIIGNDRTDAFNGKARSTGITVCQSDGMPGNYLPVRQSEMPGKTIYNMSNRDLHNNHQAIREWQIRHAKDREIRKTRKYINKTP